MNEILREEPQTHFFLSCDDAVAERLICRAVPNVTTQTGTGAFNSTEGVRDSVADLYLLAASTHLVGPYLSSFVELAWILGGKTQVMENSVHRFDRRTSVHRHAPMPNDFHPPTSELFVRNSVLVAWGKVGARGRARSDQ
jgi:hypothetical protein